MRSKPPRLPSRGKEGSPVQRLACYALIVKDNALLLCRLAGNVRPAGYWTLPGGGVEFGEHPEEAAIREVIEETGLEVELDSLAGIDSMVYRFPGPPRHAVRLLFHAHVVGGRLKHEAHGSTDFCDWITREQAEQLQLVDLAELGMNLALGTAEKAG